MFQVPALAFDLGDDIAAMREAVHDFASNEIAPRAAAIDVENVFPVDLWRRMHLTAEAQLGVFRRGHHARLRLTQRRQHLVGVVANGRDDAHPGDDDTAHAGSRFSRPSGPLIEADA